MSDFEVGVVEAEGEYAPSYDVWEREGGAVQQEVEDEDDGND